MIDQPFESEIVRVRRRLMELELRTASLPSRHRAFVTEVLESLSTALEELQVAGEELRQQNEELLASARELEAAQRRYQDLFEFAPDGYLVTDPEGVILEANRAASELLAVPPRRLIGLPLVVFIASKDREEFHRSLTRLHAERRQPQAAAEWEVEVHPHTGGPFPAALTVAQGRNDRGGLAGLRWLLRDVSASKRAAERENLLVQAEQDRRRIEALNARAQQQAAELEAVFAALVDPVTVYDAEGAIFRANPAAVKSLGLDPVGLPATVVGQIVSVRHPDGLPVPADDLVAARALHGETVRDAVELIVHASGDERTILASAAPIITGGRISGAVAIWHDITNLKQAEEALQRANQALELTQAASGAGSWDWDIRSGRLEWSPTMFELFGLDMQTSVASFDAWRSVLHPEDREAAQKRIDLALETHSGLASEYRIIRPDGQLRWISALGRGVYDEQGRPCRMSGICLDITDRKRGEARVEHLSSFPRLDPNPVLETDASGTITFRNAATGEALERLGLEDDARAFLPDDWAVILQTLEQKQESALQREVLVGGATFSETVQVIPAFNVVRIYAFEITQRKWAEEALRSAQLQVEGEKRHLQAILRTLPVGVIVTDAQGGVVLTNGMDEQIWGPRPLTQGINDYAQYKAWWADSGKAVEPHEWASAQAVLEGKSVFGQVLEIQRFDGGRGFIINSAVPIRDEEGRIVGSAVAIQDITELRHAEQSLRASEEKYRLLFQNMTEGFALYELLYDEQGKPVDWRILEVNDAYKRHTGLAREQVVGRRISELFPASIPEYLPRFAAVVATQTPAEFEMFSKAVGRHQHVVTFPVGDHRFANIIEDISDRKRAEEALRASEEKFAAVFRFSPAGIAIARADDGTFVDVNEALTKTLGYTQSEVVGARVADTNLVPSSDALGTLVQLFVEQGQVLDYEMEFETKGGESATMLVSLGPIQVGEEACILAVTHDITKRRRTEEALRRADAALALASHERARLEERQRLARELHDSVSQALYGISLGAHTALTQLDTDRDAVRDALSYVLSLAQAGLDELRAVIFDLRPESLEREGLVVALRKQAAALRAAHGLAIELELTGEPAAPLPAKEALYRISQEALQNAVKHARADRLEVRLTHGPDGLGLEVSDNGVGFDSLALHPGHLGLVSMRERAAEIGGTLEVTSTPECGTRVRVHVPIAAGEREPARGHGSERRQQGSD